MKKLLFATVVILIVLSSFASVLVTPIAATDDAPLTIQDLCWWSNVSGGTPNAEFLPTPDVNVQSNSNSLTLTVQTLTIPASKDTLVGYAENAWPDTNYGSRPSFAVWNYSPYDDLTSLLEFSLASLPANAEIYYAKLQLYGFNFDGYSNIPVGVYKQLHTDWEELQATYNIYKTGSSWTTQGGDYVTSNPVGSVTTVPPSSQGWVQWDITDIVSDARNSSIPVELLVKATAYGNDYSDVGFISKEYSTDPTLRPKLSIEYTTDGSPTPTPTPTATPWSFAIITDTHIGEGLGDYGGTGWNDPGSIGQEYNTNGDPIPSVRNLRIAAQWANLASNPYSPCFLNTKFVVVDGDLTDSAEMSEFGKAKEILGTLSIPWVPILGNHDVWPNTATTRANVSDLHNNQGYSVDWYFNETMSYAYDDFAASIPTFGRGPVTVSDGALYRSFQNFNFSYGGFYFIGLDFNERGDSLGQGTWPWANYWNIPNGTWPWLLNNLNQYASINGYKSEKVILFSHHPMYRFFHAGFISLGGLEGDLRQYKDDILVQFCGHLHQAGSDKWHGPEPISYYNYYDAIKTKANKDDPQVRIVQVFPDGTIDYDTILPKDAASFMAHCPVDLILTDPDGLVVSRTETQVPDAMYYKWDFDEDGQLETKIWISERKSGTYSIQVIPESYANESDTFTLTVSPMEYKWGYTPITMAQNVSISDIPAEPYTFEFTQRTATNISYTGGVSGYMLDTVNLTAALSTDNGSSLSGKTINFVIVNQSVSAVTDVNGIATASITLNQTPSEFYYVEYGFAGDKDYLPCYDAQPFIMPPVADAGGPYTGTEGSPLTLNGNGTYDPESRFISYEWDLDNDGVYDDATGVTPAYTWNDDYFDSICLRVTDAGDAYRTATATITVNNVPPTVEAGADINNAIAGTAINFNGSFTDPGTLDTHTIEWNFGDGSPTVNGTLTPTHTYTSSGNYTVTLTVTDDDGGVGTDTLAINTMPATTTYTFATSGGINKWCSAGHVHLIDWIFGHPHSPSDLSASPTYGFISGSSTEYTQVSSSNNVYWKSNIAHCLGCCAFDRNAELFTFKINGDPSTITDIQIKWEGHGTTGETIYYTTEKLWKTSSNSWSTLNDRRNIKSDATWTNVISTNCADYIDGTGNLSVLIAAQRSGLPNNCGIWTDYIEVTITH